jgi:hypothetical protein
VSAAAEADAKLQSLRQADQVELGRWIASGAGATGDSRPEPSAATLSAERDLALAAVDADAARSALPALNDAWHAATERVRATDARRDEAVFAAAAAIARERAVELRRRVLAVLAVEAELTSVADELYSIGRRGLCAKMGNLRGIFE